MEKTKVRMAFFIEKRHRKATYGGYLPREVTAVFADSGNYSIKDCYAHIGQHGNCSMEWIAERNRPAKPSEYAELLNELENLVGYEVEVVDAKEWLVNDCHRTVA